MKLKIKRLQEGVWLLGVGGAILLHNFVSGLIGREEVVFFGLTFVFLIGFLVSILNRLTKNYWLTMLGLVILGMDLAAIADIAKGEPQVYEEWGTLIVSIVVIGWWWKNKRN